LNNYVIVDELKFEEQTNLRNHFNLFGVFV